VLITSAGASTRIEGANLSDDDVERLMRGLSIRKLAERDAAEVRGYYELLQTVFESWEDIPLTESGIRHLHRELLKYVPKDEHHRGKYKSLDNRVVALDASGNEAGVVFETTPPYLTEKEMGELVEWTARSLSSGIRHPLLAIAGFTVQFLKIHPFLDGNGRLSRVLTNLLLLKEGYGYAPYVSHEKLVEARKADYYLALRRSQRTFGTDREKIVPWLDFFLSVALEQAEAAIGLLSEEAVDRLLSPAQLRVWEAVRDAPGDIAPGEIALASGVPRPTVNQALDRLLKLRKIDRVGLGRSTRYRKA